MFKGIQALLKTLEEVKSIDEQCKKLSVEMESVIPELRDNTIAIAFARDGIVGLNGHLKAIRDGAETVVETVKKTVEPSPSDDELVGSSMSEMITDVVQNESVKVEEEEDDESGIIVERIDPVVKDENPIPDFEHEEGDKIYPLERVEDWDELSTAKIEGLVSAGADKEARALKKHCKEIRNTMYDENGDQVLIATENTTMTKGAKAVWNAAIKEVTRLKARDDYQNMSPEQQESVDEFLSDSEFSEEPGTEPQAEDVDALLEDLEQSEEEPEPEKFEEEEPVDDELEELLASIDE